jgi:D-alanine-D-alanine ligase-like ATP-grasp enzyme
MVVCQEILINLNLMLYLMRYTDSLVRDGYIQTILEGFKIPYTHSGVVASSLAMDKAISKKIFIQNKINTPRYIKYSYEENNFDLIKNNRKESSNFQL